MSQQVDALPLAVDESSRERIIEDFAPRVRYIAHRIASRLPAHIDLGDLISSGVIGLIDAIEKFDSSKNVKFETYAEFRIRGAILDELRALDWVPRSVRQKGAQLENAYQELQSQLGRSPDEEDVARVLNLSAEEVHDLISEVKGVSILSLDELREYGYQDEGEAAFGDSLASDLENPGQSIAWKEIREVLVDGVENLPRGKDWFSRFTITKS